MLAQETFTDLALFRWLVRAVRKRAGEVATWCSQMAGKNMRTILRDTTVIGGTRRETEVSWISWVLVSIMCLFLKLNWTRVFAVANLYVFVIRFGKGHVLPLWLCKICCLLCFLMFGRGAKYQSLQSPFSPFYCLEMWFPGYLIIGAALAISSLVHVYVYLHTSKKIRDPT